MGGLEEKGFGFGREAVQYMKKKEEGKKKSFNAVCLKG